MYTGNCINQASIGAHQPLIADPETEPHKYEIQRLSIYHLSPESSSSAEDKIVGKV